MDESNSDHENDKNSDISRRHFIEITATTVAAVAVASNPTAAKIADASSPAKNGIPLTTGSIAINGKEYKITIDTRTTLLDLLRENLHLTGAKKGCDHGQCGACTVLVNGQRINSCLSLAAQNFGQKVTTIEGLAEGDELHPMQKAFIEHDAFQCGFCTPGQIMSAVALLKEPCGKSEQDVRECMSGNICRCGAYRNIVAAIEDVRGQNASL